MHAEHTTKQFVLRKEYLDSHHLSIHHPGTIRPPQLTAKPIPSHPIGASHVDEMIPVPYFPYSYMNCEYRVDGKEGHHHPVQFHPYFVSQPVPPNMVTNLTDMPSHPMAVFGTTRPSLVPTANVTADPPTFGPGPPIVTGERLKGPRGCNLFVFHLPNEITNWDLYLLFRRFGTIISVHIMVNKATGLSKGYGFVSFAFNDDANAAIELMDGFRLGKKRLKVQLKRLQDDMDDDAWSDERGDNDSHNKLSPSNESLSAATSNEHSAGDLDSTELRDLLPENGEETKSPAHAEGKFPMKPASLSKKPHHA